MASRLARARPLSSLSPAFAVARLRRNVLGNSDLGLIFLNREATGPTSGPPHNRSYGVDANLRLVGNKLVINSYLAASEASDSTSNGTAPDLGGLARLALGRVGDGETGGGDLRSGHRLRALAWRAMCSGTWGSTPGLTSGGSRS